MRLRRILVQGLAFAMLLIAAISLAAVCERVLAACWQAYKFLGYPATGAITLSLRSGISFIGLSAILFAVSLFLRRYAKRAGFHAGARAAMLSAWVAIISVVMYAALSLSPFSIWT